MYKKKYEFYKNIFEKELSLLNFENAPDNFKLALKYSLNLGGKRLRPILAIASFNLISDDINKVLPIAIALELIHTYSLIHDDLPCMDNDTLRRGQPTNHMVYGENIALLAGDGLLNYAYELLFDYIEKTNYDVNVIKSSKIISKYSGIGGMIAGQYVDINNEKDLNLETLKYIHNHKTADLIIASVLSGLQIANPTDEQVKHARDYGYNLGMAFQTIDDILDVIGSKESIGKSTGIDKINNKLTTVSLYGVEKSFKIAKEYTDNACESLFLGFKNYDFLISLAKDFIKRIK